QRPASDQGCAGGRFGQQARSAKADSITSQRGGNSVSNNVTPLPCLGTLATTISSVLGTSLLSPPASAQEGEALEEVMVTGSRIVRRDFVAPSPIMTVDSARLSQSST